MEHARNIEYFSKIGVWYYKYSIFGATPLSDQRAPPVFAAAMIGPLRQTVLECRNKQSGPFSLASGTVFRGRLLRSRLPRPYGQITPKLFRKCNLDMAAILGGAEEFVDYAASKVAIDAVTIGPSKEFATDKVRVNGVRPGLIDTNMQYQVSGKNRARNLLDTVPLRRVGTPLEVAEAVAWLLSGAPAYVTGSTIAVSGGR